MIYPDKEESEGDHCTDYGDVEQPSPLAQAMARPEILKGGVNEVPSERGKKERIKKDGPGGVPLHQSLAYL